MPARPSQILRTWIEIDRRSLVFNLRPFQKLARGKALMAVIKSNAYGHGLVQVATLLANSKFEFQNSKFWMGVDSVVEALALRREGIRNPILVLGYTLPTRLGDAARGRISVTVSHFEALRALARIKKPPAFHLKIDTGMHRQGFQEHEMPKLIASLRKNRLTPEGIYSHYAAPANRAFSEKQRACFERCRDALRRAGMKPKFVHMSSTGSAAFDRAREDTIIRVGLGLYGYLPSPQSLNRPEADASHRYWASKSQIVLKPVLAWKTIVGEVKRVMKGELIGYDLTERVRRDSMIAILPVGYWHGFDRGLSSVGEVLIRGKCAKVLGRVSMDMIAVDMTGIHGAKVGDEAVIIGRQGRERISADDIAQKIGTSAYEVLTRINPLIKKIVV